MSKNNPELDQRQRDAAGHARRKRSDAVVLGLDAFERISAVEGVNLSREMKRDLEAIDAESISGAERSRFINDRYGRK